MKIAVIFSGQGGHKKGMGDDFYHHSPEARSVFDIAEQVTDYPITNWIQSKPEQFNQTRYAQIGIAAVSLAIFNTVKPYIPAITSMAGLSLGQYSALIAAEMLTIEDGFKLLKERGEIMSQVSEDLKSVHDVGMLAVMNMPIEEINEIVDDLQNQKEVIYISNYNAKNQIILAGESSALKSFRKLARQAGFRRVMPLKVEGPFHSPLMQTVCEPFSKIVAQYDFKQSNYPVIDNVTVEPLTPETIESRLINHMVEPVRWSETIDLVNEQGIDLIIQIGPGDALQKMLQRDHVPIESIAIDQWSDIESLKEKIKGA